MVDGVGTSVGELAEQVGLLVGVSVGKVDGCTVGSGVGDPGM